MKPLADVTREQWLITLVNLLKPHFAACGGQIPERLRISTGWPSSRAMSSGNGSRTVGQCWPPSASNDNTTEIFISPYIDDAMKLAGIVAHELVHATVGCEEKHGAPFKRLAKAIGLTGKMTATTEGPIFVAAVQPLLKKLVPWPGASLDGSARKKQTTRLLKAECSG